MKDHHNNAGGISNYKNDAARWFTAGLADPTETYERPGALRSAAITVNPCATCATPPERA